MRSLSVREPTNEECLLNIHSCENIIVFYSDIKDYKDLVGFFERDVFVSVSTKVKVIIHNIIKL